MSDGEGTARLTSDAHPPAGFRYGVVFLLVVGVVVFLILAPARDWAAAVAFLLESAALVVVIATTRTRPRVRRARTTAAAVAAAAWVVAIAAGVMPEWLVLASGGALSVVIPVALVGGLARLVRERGATPQAVAGGLAIYLLIGLAFVWMIGLAARVGSGPYFAGGTDGTQSTRVYFSFTVLTTTGFGDLTPGNAVGRALAVVEMLVGQLYLVTVIGILVGHLARR